MRTLDHAACARAIFESIGGGENLVSAAHCATRLRLVVVDAHKVDQKRLESLSGVMGVFCAGGQLQIILGTGTVNRVYEEFIKLSGLPGVPAAQKCTAPVLPLPQRLVKTLGDVFVPILPAIVAAGLLTGILDALGRALPAVAAADWFSFLKMVSGTAFVSLPVLVALSSARVFGGNLFLGGVVGLCMVHPTLLNAWSVGTAENVPVWHLLCFNVKQVGYQGHVIPVIMAVWLMSRLERWFRSRAGSFCYAAVHGAYYHLCHLYHPRPLLFLCGKLHDRPCKAAQHGGAWHRCAGHGGAVPRYGGLRPAPHV